ncbi:TPA: hypothetical protein JBG11_14905, partial [Legionella pneumophila]|nr:hypothetical protein [Legionella pneumophila]
DLLYPFKKNLFFHKLFLRPIFTAERYLTLVTVVTINCCKIYKKIYLKQLCDFVAYKIGKVKIRSINKYLILNRNEIVRTK